MKNNVKLSKYCDENFSLEEIENMSEEEIESYNESRNHKLKIYDKQALMVLGMFVPSFFILLLISKRTQRVQRKYIWIPHWILYAIVALIVIIVVALR